VSETIRALLQAVLDEPGDIANRRVYADALVTAGDPRGELINVQCDLAAMTSSDPRWTGLLTRERALLAKHSKTWIAPFKAFTFRPKFQRGMIEHAFVNAKKFVPSAGELLEREPIISLGMRALTQANAAILGARPEVARIEALRVFESSLGQRGAKSLFTPRLAKLRKLDLYQAGIDDAGLEHLAPLFPQLQDLNLSGNPLSMTAVQNLLGDRRLSRLTALSMKWLAPGSDGATEIAESLQLPALARLDLGSSRYSDRDLRRMAGNATFAKLKELRLEHNELSGVGAVEALAPLTQLEVLDLSTNTIGVDGLVALVKSGFPLRALRLYQCAIGAVEAGVLARGAFPKLAALDLGYGSLGPTGMAALARTTWPLEKLELWANKILDEGAAELAHAPWTRTLRELVIGYIGIGNTGVAALAAGNWPALERIVFRGDSIGEAGARALAEATTMPALRSIKFEGTSTPKAALAPLRRRGVDLDVS
jgi:uncharacterized protein (TIGR02996 family)